MMDSWVTPFGRLANSAPATLYSLRNRSGASVHFTDYGAALVGLCLPNSDGTSTDVVSGFDTIAGYEQHTGFLGAVCGRYANRLSDASFVLNGSRYHLPQNEGRNQLHGGPMGFDKQLWDAISIPNGVCFSRLSPDGEMGFPSDLAVRVRYTWSDENILRIEYEAHAQADTICNLTNHTYWNLDGAASGDATGMRLQIEADFYTPINADLLPDGSILPVAGPFDLRLPKRLQDGLSQRHPQLLLAGGYDHNFVLRKFEPGAFCRAATLFAARSGHHLEVWTDRPGLQFYSGNSMAGWIGKQGAAYKPRSAVALETQLFPDAMAHPYFPSPVLRAGRTDHSVTEYRLVMET